MITKIVILGPESTGKSSLCEQLAAHYNTRWVPEYAREYLLEHGTDYSYEDLLTIARGQVALEDRICAEVDDGPIFIDTDMYVMKVWSEFVFGKVHPWITEQLNLRTYNLYLLCKPDMPWVKDELREYPDLETREKLFRIYRDLMTQQSVPFQIIEGNYTERFALAVRAIQALT